MIFVMHGHFKVLTATSVSVNCQHCLLRFLCHRGEQGILLNFSLSYISWAQYITMEYMSCQITKPHLHKWRTVSTTAGPSPQPSPQRNDIITEKKHQYDELEGLNNYNPLINDDKDVNNRPNINNQFITP